MEPPTPITAHIIDEEMRVEQLKAQCRKLTLIQKELKSGIMAILWEDPLPQGGLMKLLPTIAQVVNFILLLIILFTK